jgi:UDP-N-acetylglucosamine 2-epimerase (non-hydrolysing)
MTGRPKVRVVCVAGVRPNFVKAAPLLRALRARELFDARLVHTGQHQDPNLSSAFLEDLAIPAPDVHLQVPSGSHAQQTAEIMKALDPVLFDLQPHAVVVVGDVNSTLAAALVAAKLVLRSSFRTRFEERRRPLLVHVEAGLRSFDADMPEEANRRVTDVLADLLYVTEPAGLANLAREGIPADRAVLVGNLMIDSLLAARDLASRSSVVADLGGAGPYGVVTLHRPGNVDDPATLRRIIGVLDRLSGELPLVFPVHPRTESRLRELGVSLRPPGWRVVQPLRYPAFVRLLGGARVAFTDSGGVQDETVVLGVPCLTLRPGTERPITVEQGTNQVVGTAPEAIEAGFRRALAAPARGAVPPLWDGHAAERVADHLERVLVA